MSFHLSLIFVRYLFYLLIFKWVSDIQLSELKGELQRLHEENRKLRNMLDQTTKSYNDLQSQLLLAMQKLAHGSPQGQVNLVSNLITFYLNIR